MAKKKQAENLAYKKLKADLKAGTPERVYVFHGEERYLLEDTVRKLRAMVAKGTEEFNHHVLDGKNLSMDALSEAVDAFPVFSERTMTEVSDFDFSKTGEETRKELLRILSDVPDYTCVVFVADTVEYKLDGRIKANQELKKLLTEVEFTPLDSETLMSWLARGFASGGKRVTREAAAKLIEMTGGLMTGMRTEVEKLISYVPGDTVETRDVEAVVTPVPDAALWQLTDALLEGRGDAAMERLRELETMDVAPHAVVASVSEKLRQLLTAKIYQGSGLTVRDLMRDADIRFEFQARAVFAAARRLDKESCARLCKMAARTAYKLNSSAAGENTDLTRELAVGILLITGGRT